VVIGVLEVIEGDLRKHYSCPDLVLADFFDVVGGTSTVSPLEWMPLCLFTMTTDLKYWC
jgi:hypothetical protein